MTKIEFTDDELVLLTLAVVKMAQSTKDIPVNPGTRQDVMTVLTDLNLLSRKIGNEVTKRMSNVELKCRTDAIFAKLTPRSV